MKKWFFVYKEETNEYFMFLGKADIDRKMDGALLASCQSLSDLYGLIKDAVPSFIGKTGKTRWLYTCYQKFGNHVPKENR